MTIMAGNTRMTHHAALMLLFITCRINTLHLELKVDPPEDLVIVDLGHLGHVEVTWKTPANLVNTTHCPKIYQLEYFNTYKDRWTAIRTSLMSYSVQFDLMKDIQVRVYTLLSGPCTNGKVVKSSSFAELVQRAPSTGGAVSPAVTDFTCVFYNMEKMECRWRRSPEEAAAASRQTLYFWHERMDHAKECPKYIVSGGVRTGCNFTEKPLPDFTDINFCINGSSAGGKMPPAFISLQIQDHVKPAATEKLYLQSGPGAQLEFLWERPVGKVPGHCLEWEVEQSQWGPGGEIQLKQILTEQTNLTLARIHGDGRNCLRVRSRLHEYCVEKSFWSEWSQTTCHPDVEKTEPVLEPEWTLTTASLHIAFATVAVVLLSVVVGTLLKLGRSRREDKTNCSEESPLHSGRCLQR